MAAINESNAATLNRKILEISCKAFAKRGYEGTRLSYIASEAGVTTDYIKKTFGTKEALYCETAHIIIRDYSKGFIYADNLSEMFTSLVEIVKGEARANSAKYRFFIDFLCAPTISNSRKELLKTCFEHSGISEKLEQGIAMGVLVKGNPYDILRMFIKAAFCLTECYVEGAVSLPPTEEYLKLVMNGDRAGSINPLGWKGITGEERSAFESDYVIARLAGNYDGIAYVTIHKDDKYKDYAKIYRYSREFSRIIPGWTEEMGFSKRLDLLAEYLVHPDDRERFLRETKRTLILGAVEESTAYVVNFRVVIDGATYNYEMKFIPDKGPDKTVSGLIVGMHNMDAEVSQERFREIERGRNYNIIRALSAEYTDVCYYNPDDDVVFPLNMSERITDLVGSKIRGARFSEAVDAYIKAGVIENAKDEMRHALSLPVILDKIKDGGIYKKIYLNNDGNYCEMKIVGAGEGNNAFVMGFSVQDEKIRSENMRESMMEDVLRVFHDKEGDEAIREILKLATAYYSADRVSLYTLSKDGTTMIPSFMHNNEKATPLRTNRLSITRDRVQKWCEEIIDLNPVYIDVKAGNIWLSEEVNRFLELNGIDSVMANPITLDDNVVALLIIDAPKRNADEYMALRLVGAISYNVLLLKNQTEEGQRTLGKLVEAFESVQYVDFVEDYLHTYSAHAEFMREHSEKGSYRTLIREYIDKRVEPEDRERVQSETNPLRIREELKRRGSVSVKFKDRLGGAIRDYELRYFKANPEGTAAVICGIDNTDIIYHERLIQVRLTKAIEEANAASTAKSEFLSHMSHDIRTPLNGVIGMTEIARMNVGDSDKISECLDKIDVASNHLLSLVNDVLDMSRIESGKTVITSEPFNVEHFANECFEIVSNQTLSKDLELVKEFGKFRHPDVLGDELHLRQILINILGNALKFTPAGGRVIFRVREVRRGFKRASYVFEVEDNGIGMKPAFIEHIWEPFLQEAGSARTTYKGTGLGMSITKHLVELMGGNISVQSELNVGSTFRVEVAFPINESAVPTYVDNRPINIKGCRILLVEDNEINADVVREILVSQGALMDVAVDGKLGVEAFENSEEGFYDIILMDIMMPVMDGLEATRIIRKLPRTDAKMVPIIAMTANAFDEDISKAMAAGMDAHLAKPIDVKMMLHTISDFYSVEVE